MCINNWIPEFSYQHHGIGNVDNTEHFNNLNLDQDVLYLRLKYPDTSLVTICYNSWNLLNVDSTCTDIKNSFAVVNDSLERFLYLDLKNRPAVSQFLQAGPPGDYIKRCDKSIQELAILLTKNAYNEYIKFVKQTN